MNRENIKTTWDLSLLYESPEDQIGADIEHAKEAYEEFADEYRNDDSYLKDPKALREALEKLEFLGGEKNLSQPVYFYNYRKDLDANDQEAESRMNQLNQLYSKLSNKIRFFELRLGNLPDEKQEEFLNSEELKHYHKYLRQLFKTAKYKLDEKEENILSLTSLPRNEMWVNGVSKARSKKTVEWEGGKLPLPEALSKIEDLPTQKRRKLWGLCMDTLQEIKEFAESELNALVTDKKISDEIRGYEKPYSSTVIGYENTEDEVETLIETVTNNFDIAAKFYELKADLLDEDTLTYADRNASIGSLDEELPFERAVEIVHDAYADMDSQFSQILEEFLGNGQVDVFPEEGKSSGAYCSSATYMPTFVLLNHVDNFTSLTTLAHEMGHAIHAELSKEQSPLYQGHPPSTAEVASTFFETVVFNRVFETLDKDQKIIALHDRINRNISTIFRQIACFNFEKDLHSKIREAGSLSHKDMADLMNEHMQNYLGDLFELERKDGYFFVHWSHLRRPFYVYTYAYGDLISKAMFAKFQENNNYINKVKQFLEAGSCKTPRNIFADIGIDTSSPTVFKTGIQSVKEDIDELEKLIT